MSKMTFYTWFALEYNVHTLHLVEASFKSLLIYNDLPSNLFSMPYIWWRDQFVCSVDFPHSGCGWLCFPGGNVSSVPHSFCLPVWGSFKFRSLFTTTVFHGRCWVLPVVSGQAGLPVCVSLCQCWWNWQWHPLSRSPSAFHLRLGQPLRTTV